MLSQTFCYWDKQQSADSNIIQFYLALKCTIDQSSHLHDRLLALNWTFHHHDRSLTKFYAGSESSLVCVVINIPHHPAVKTNNSSLSCIWQILNAGKRASIKILLEVICCSLYVNQTTLNVKSRTKLGGQAGGQPKIWGDMAHPGSPLESPLDFIQFRRRSGLTEDGCF